MVKKRETYPGFKAYLGTKFDPKTQARTIVTYANATHLVKPSWFEASDDDKIAFINGLILEHPHKTYIKYAVNHLLDFKNLSHLKEHLTKGRYKVKKEINRDITEEDIAKLFDSISVEEYNLLFRCQYEAGCRINAIINITAKDVRESKGLTRISVVEKGDDRRRVTIRPITARLLHKFIKSKQLKDNDKVFGSISYMQAWYYLQKKSKEVLGFKITSHWFRYGRAIHLLEEGQNIMTVKEKLGHKHIQTTSEYLRKTGLATKQTADKVVPLYEKKVNER